MPFYPQIAVSQGVYPTFYPFAIFTFGLAVEFIKEFRGASTKVAIIFHLKSSNSCRLNYFSMSIPSKTHLPYP
jgi:hypothetical protein